MRPLVVRRLPSLLALGLVLASAWWLVFGTLGVRAAFADTPSPVPTASASGLPRTTAPSVDVSGGASTPSSTPAPGAAPAAPTGAELLAAVATLLAGAVLGGMVILLVRRTHELQATLARKALAHGEAVSTQTGPAAGGDESRLEGEPGGEGGAPGSPPIAITGPDEVTVGAPAEYTATGGADSGLAWTVTGLSSYERTQSAPRTITVIPRSPGEGTVSLTDGTLVASHGLKALSETNASGGFQLQLAIRNWGLVVVAIGIVFGAIALGLAGILSGAEFIALIAPLAALLGVTAAANRSSSGGGS
ncbi:MAG TPA: hypothetical protein VFP34_01920 [Microlunatus sp.]|nr:hypothetical protein [Microlunatus sp.]